MLRTFFIVLTAIILSVSRQAVVGDRIILKTKQGSLEGDIIHPESDFPIDQFLGIRFGKSPTRERRFKKPEPVDNWEGVLPAVNWGPRCVQTMVHGEFYPQGLPESEDCLYLNVFAPHDKATDLLPVFFWIHGGGFSAGTAMEYPAPYAIVREGIVVVSIQYRLGAYGFFTTDSDEARGNWGLWDQTLALQWVRDNIKVFWGDKDRVTVVGESAGGATASLLSISTHSRDLFSSLILMSGTHHAPWALSSGVRESSEWLAGKTGCDVPSMDQRMNCMRAIELEALRTSLKNAEISDFDGMGFFPGSKMTFVPTLDGDFLPADRSLSQLLAESDPKPVILGTTADEIGFFVTPPIALVDTAWTVRDPTEFSFHRFRQFLRNLIPDRKMAGADGVRAKALRYYVYDKGDKKDSEFLVKQFIQLLNDVLMFLPTLQDAQSRSVHGWPTWLYSFDYYNLKEFPPNCSYPGAFHGIELTYLFEKTLFSALEFDEEDKATSRNMIRIFSNFVKNGIPDDTWTPISALDTNPYLIIGPSLQPSVHSYSSEAWAFWSELFNDDLSTLFSPPYGDKDHPEPSIDDVQADYDHAEL